MLFFRKIKKDKCLKEFVSYCKNKYKDNLSAILIYGSYAWGYFDKKASDYDIFVVFKNDIPSGEKEAIEKLFPLISLQYFCTTSDLLKMIKEGHWAVYITLLKTARLLYYNKDYKNFFIALKKIQFPKKLNNIDVIKEKIKYEIRALKGVHGFKGNKWSMHTLRKRLQLLTYLKTDKVVWDLKKVINYNKDLVNNNNKMLLLEIEKRISKRESRFSKENKKGCINILKKLDKEILNSFNGG